MSSHMLLLPPSPCLSRAGALKNWPRLILTLLLVRDALAIDVSQILSTSNNSWTLLYQNNLNSSDDTNHVGALLTDSISRQDGINACKAAREAPMTWDLISAHQNDFIAQFNYLCYSKVLNCPATLWIQDGTVIAEEDVTSIKHFPGQGSSAQTLPQLCTQSGKGNSPSNSGPSSLNQIAVVSKNNSNTYVGYRNQKSFRFQGVRFAAKPSRFTHSEPDASTHQVSNNTLNAPECVQDDGDQTSEDCLFLNIQTPHLPKADLSTGNLKPVLFYIHGGAMLSGSSNDPTTDGSNLASREDVVVVNINYRLGTYGFFAVPNDTHYTGNYGVGDVISALQWTHANIASFGGDASRISLVGQSAGAALVRALMGSPKATGLFHNAIAMSNLGGAVDLGESEDWGTANTFYYTAQKSFDSAGASLLTSAGCDGADLANRIECLVIYNGLGELTPQARWIVQDGTYVTGPYLEAGSPGSVARVPFLTGNMADDGASFTANEACDGEVDCLARDLGISRAAAQSVVDSRLFAYDGGDANTTRAGFNVSQRVRTDDTFRCVDQATVYAAATTNSTNSPVFYYQNVHGLGGYNPAGVPDGSSAASAPYYRLHSADTQFVFGNVPGDALRPGPTDDLVAMRLLSAYWAAFVRSGDPNPDPQLLKRRGYMDTYRAVTAAGPWAPVVGRDGPLMVLDARPQLQNAFVDVPQCEFLNYSLDYFVVHPKGL